MIGPVAGQRRFVVRGVLVVLWLSVCLPVVAWSAEDTPPDRVKQAQSELGRPLCFPWYDPATDALRPIVEPQPRARPETDWSWLTKWFPNFNFNLGSWSWGDFFRLVFWLALGAALVWIIFLLWREYLRREASRATWTSTNTESLENDIPTEVLPLLPEPVTGDLLTRIHELCELGRYREAMIYLFSHRLLSLNQQQIIHLVRGKTNRQYLREVRRQPDLGPLFERSIELFERAFFGNQPLTREQFESVWRDQEAFDRHVALVGVA